jgi:hypothetical protein
LQVASEDTVLYTAETYFRKGSWRQDSSFLSGAFQASKEAAYKQQLAWHIRCPHLSQFWLAAAAFSPDAGGMLLADLQPEIQQLFFVKQADPYSDVPGSYIPSQISSAPTSWLQPPRSKKQLGDGVQVRWTLSVADIKAAALQSASQGGKASLKSAVTPPIGGLTWYMNQVWVWDAEKKGSEVGMFVMPGNPPADVVYSYALDIECSSSSTSFGKKGPEGFELSNISQGQGFEDFFEVGHMQGGWDDAVWSAKGLPLAGDLTFSLHVKAVGHAAKQPQH